MTPTLYAVTVDGATLKSGLKTMVEVDAWVRFFEALYARGAAKVSWFEYEEEV